MSGRQTVTALLACLIIPAMVGGCISIGGSSNSKNEPSAAIYTLQVSPSKESLKANTGAATAIVVPAPELPTGFETDRIALYFEHGHQLDYYADARWSGRLDELLQNFIIQAARHAFPKEAVGTSDLSSSARYKLAVKITDFQPVYSGGSDGIPRLDVANDHDAHRFAGRDSAGQYHRE